jgi:hypothetical protein
MSVAVLTQVSYNISSGAFKQLATVVGEIDILMYTNSSIFLVCPADDATAAAAENSAGRSLILPSGVTALKVDPCKTWIISTGSAGTAYIIRQT